VTSRTIVDTFIVTAMYTGPLTFEYTVLHSPQTARSVSSGTERARRTKQ
jgi:hypothetical protein